MHIGRTPKATLRETSRLTVAVHASAIEKSVELHHKNCSNFCFQKNGTFVGKMLIPNWANNIDGLVEECRWL